MAPRTLFEKIWDAHEVVPERRGQPALLFVDLDEGTAALDNISERRVQEAIVAARADRTVIIVAHRLSTLRDANRIFVFADGRIVETGSYEELLQLGGVFTELVRSAEGSHE